MKKIILFDIDYTLSDRAYLKNFGRKYLANLVGKTRAEVNPVIDKIILESIKRYQVFNVYYYAKRITQEYKDESLEQKIRDMFFVYYPNDKAIYPEVKYVLSELRKRYVLGVQSDGQKIFQFNKIRSIINFFNKKYIYIFKNKTGEIYRKIKLFADRVIIIDDKPDHIEKLSKKGIRAILIMRGPYAEKYLVCPKKFPDIKETINTLNDLIKLL